MISKYTLLLLFPVLVAVPLTHTTHEEKAVRQTYAALTQLCSSGSNPAPTFEITNVKTGTIQSIAKLKWTTRATIPDDGVVLTGQFKTKYLSVDGKQKSWNEMHVHWDVDDSYTPDRMELMQSFTVGKAVALGGKEWTVPATYTRYATFQVVVTFQGRTVGPYTASFFFGRDARGTEVIAPQDAIVSGQLLWYAVTQPHKLTAAR